MASNDATRVITPVGTLSYPHLAAPQKPKEGDSGKKPKYGATIVFAPGTKLNELQSAALAAATDKWGKEWKLPGGKTIPIAQAFAEGVLRSPFRKDAVAKGYPEGSVFVNARSDDRPQCVITNAEATGVELVPLENVKELFYAGARVRASLRAFAYDNSGNKGVSFALNSVHKVGEGERLDNRVDAVDEFTATLDAVPASLDDVM